MPLTPTQKLRVRKAMSDYCLLAERNRLKWTYVQQRPFHGFGVPADQPHVADCSAYVSLVFNWAMHACGVYLADPLGQHYNGTGYTGTELAFFQAYGKQVNVASQLVLVGDCAIFGIAANTVHTAICRTKGSWKAATLSSNGHGSTIFAQDAPEPVTLANAAAAQHLVGVYRHPALL